jgi:RND family efflux transporter MFP subunit
LFGGNNPLTTAECSAHLDIWMRDLFPPKTDSVRALLLRLSVVVCGTLLSGCGGRGPAGDELSGKAELPTIRAEVLTVEMTAWPSVVRTQGTLAADLVAVVGTKVAGRIEAVHVDLGDFVHAGDPLARLDDEESRLQVAQAEAQLAEACAAVGLQPGAGVETLDRMKAPPVRQEKALWDEAIDNLKRGRDLHARNAISEAEVERLEAVERVAAARYASSLNSVEEKIALIAVRTAELALARQQLDEAVIQTPFDGRILQRQVSPGEYVSTGQAIATVVRSDPLRFRGTVPERRARQVMLGQPVTLRIESVIEPRVVKVTRISPVLDELTRALTFEALVDNSDGRLQTGLFAEGEVELDAKAKSLAVPSSAAEKVWKLVDGAAREQEVRTGRRRADAIEIIAGLAVGDRILLDASVGRVARIEAVTPAKKGATIASDVAGSGETGESEEHSQ